MAPRVQWLFVVRTTRNAVVTSNTLKSTVYLAGCASHFRGSSIVANKMQRGSLTVMDTTYFCHRSWQKFRGHNQQWKKQADQNRG
jgi:hypothetical protein